MVMIGSHCSVVAMMIDSFVLLSGILLICIERLDILWSIQMHAEAYGERIRPWPYTN